MRANHKFFSTLAPVGRCMKTHFTKSRARKAAQFCLLLFTIVFMATAGTALWAQELPVQQTGKLPAAKTETGVAARSSETHEVLAQVTLLKAGKEPMAGKSALTVEAKLPATGNIEAAQAETLHHLGTRIAKIQRLMELLEEKQLLVEKKLDVARQLEITNMLREVEKISGRQRLATKAQPRKASQVSAEHAVEVPATANTAFLQKLETLESTVKR